MQSTSNVLVFIAILHYFFIIWAINQHTIALPIVIIHNPGDFFLPSGKKWDETILISKKVKIELVLQHNSFHKELFQRKVLAPEQEYLMSLGSALTAVSYCFHKIVLCIWSSSHKIGVPVFYSISRFFITFTVLIQFLQLNIDVAKLDIEVFYLVLLSCAISKCQFLAVI